MGRPFGSSQCTVFVICNCIQFVIKLTLHLHHIWWFLFRCWIWTFYMAIDGKQLPKWSLMLGDCCRRDDSACVNVMWKGEMHNLFEWMRFDKRQSNDYFRIFKKCTFWLFTSSNQTNINNVNSTSAQTVTFDSILQNPSVSNANDWNMKREKKTIGKNSFALFQSNVHSITMFFFCENSICIEWNGLVYILKLLFPTWHCSNFVNLPTVLLCFCASNVCGGSLVYQ